MRAFLYGKLRFFWVAKNSVVSECRRDPRFLGLFFGGHLGTTPQKKEIPPKKKKKPGFNGKCVTHFPYTIPRTLAFCCFFYLGISLDTPLRNALHHATNVMTRAVPIEWVWTVHVKWRRQHRLHLMCLALRGSS